jgi:hypothetical protein
MAEGKKSFVLYSDQKGLWDKLSDEQAGRLIKHVIAYVNDENPIAEDFITELAFEPIKAALKRDLSRWETTIEKRREAGLASAEARKNKVQQTVLNTNTNQQKPTKTNTSQQVLTNATVSGNDSVSVSVNENVNVNENEIQSIVFVQPEEGYSQKENSLNVTVEEIIKCFSSTMASIGLPPDAYGGAEMLGNDFYNHYSSQGWRKGNGMPITLWRVMIPTWLAKQKGMNIQTTKKSSDKPKPQRSWD